MHAWFLFTQGDTLSDLLVWGNTMPTTAGAGGGMGSAAEAAASIQQRRNYGAKPVGLMTKRAGAEWALVHANRAMPAPHA